MTGRVLTCVYCGYEYPQGTPAAGSEILTEHIKVCDKHPMRAAEIKISKLRKALGDLMGCHTEADFAELEFGFVLLPDSENKKLAMQGITAMRESL